MDPTSEDSTGSYVTVFEAIGQSSESVHIGGAGACSFLVEQWIAGFAISREADPDQAAKVRRGWLRKVPQSRSRRASNRIYDLRSRQGLIRALQDKTDGHSWVQCHELGRKSIPDIRCQKLRALVELWHIATTFWDWDPAVRVSTDLRDATEISTAALEEVDAPWAVTCREVAELLRQAGPDARISIG